jgi:hypothetical protein
MKLSSGCQLGGDYKQNRILTLPDGKVTLSVHNPARYYAVLQVGEGLTSAKWMAHTGQQIVQANNIKTAYVNLSAINSAYFNRDNSSCEI